MYSLLCYSNIVGKCLAWLMKSTWWSSISDRWERHLLTMLKSVFCIVLVLWVEDRKPVEYGGFHYGGECVWEYEIEGIWSTCIDALDGMRNSGNHNCLHQCLCPNFHYRFVYLRKQASSWEEKQSSRPARRRGWKDGSFGVVWFHRTVFYHTILHWNEWNRQLQDSWCCWMEIRDKHCFYWSGIVILYNANTAGLVGASVKSNS